MVIVIPAAMWPPSWRRRVKHGVLYLLDSFSRKKASLIPLTEKEKETRAFCVKAQDK